MMTIGIGMQIIPAQTMTLQGKQIMSLEEDRMGKAYELIDFWDHAEKFILNLNFRDTEHFVKYCLAPSAFINYLTPGEKFGIRIGESLLVSSEIAKDRPKWLPYVIAKLYIQEFIDPGLDQSGRVKHWQGLFGIIRMAGAAMEKQELLEFLEFTAVNERSHYFELDQEVKDFLRQSGVDFDGARHARIKYLSSHHQNRWVKAGRMDEYLARMDFNFTGWRNHAQAVFNCLSDEGGLLLYQAAMMVRELAAMENSAVVSIPGQFSRISYCLTSQGNGLVDLVKLVGYASDGSDLIIRSNRNTTFFALQKRLSYAMHQCEVGVRNLLEQRRTEFAGLALRTKELNSQISTELTVIQQAVRERHSFAEAFESFRQISGHWTSELALLENMAGESARTMAKINDLANALAEAV